MAASTRFYPLVGGLLGTLSAGIYLLALRFFSPGVASVGAIVALIGLSGALHLDGFADMCDGFYGHHDRRKILAIMKDSRSGAMAIVGVFCLLSLKIALLLSLDTPRAALALILAPTLARWIMVLLCAVGPYARDEGGTGSAYIGQVDRPTYLIATFFGALIAYVTFQLPGLILMIIAGTFAWAFSRYVRRRIGGLTGDTLGACGEMVEVLVFGLMALRWTVP